MNGLVEGPLLVGAKGAQALCKKVKANVAHTQLPSVGFRS